MQSSKIQQLLPITPKSKLSSTQTTRATASSFSKQEPKPTATPKESGPPKSRAAESLSVKVAQMDAMPFNVAEPEACADQTGLAVAQPEAVCAFCFLYSLDTM